MWSSLTARLPLACWGLLVGTAHGAWMPARAPKLQIINSDNIACDGSQKGLGVGHFEQFLNHSNPAQGTFQQKYFWMSTYWGGPGSPVILMTPGESDLAPFCGYMSYRSLAGQFAAATNAAVVLIEHRYYGDSSPYPILTTETLQHLTLDNAAADLANFARNVKLPFDTNSSSNAPHAPWILTGGSYGGALTAWTAKLSPNTFWAYHATSAPVQAIYNFWQFFNPIHSGMPKNCSQNVEEITAYVDDFVQTRSESDIAAFKDKWGLGDLANKIDFASALSNAVDTWQDSSLTSGYTDFFKMCDAIEGYGINGSRVRQEPPDIATKVSNVAWWFKNRFIPGWCYDKFSYSDFKNPKSVGCLDSYNTSSIMYTDRTVANTANVQWFWFLCNEPFAYWQTGSAPNGRPTIATRLMTAEYFQRMCDIYFGPGTSSKSTTANASVSFGSRMGKTVDDVNNQTGGWNFKGERLLWVNGEFDPWRTASVSSQDRPGGELASTASAPIVMIAAGKHCEDLTVQNNRYLMSVQIQLVNQMVDWVNEFYNGTAPNQTRDTEPLPPITRLFGFL